MYCGLGRFTNLPYWFYLILSGQVSFLLGSGRKGMSDRPKLTNDKQIESNAPEEQDVGRSLAVVDELSHQQRSNVLSQEDSRRSSDFDQLTDEFGRRVFAANVGRGDQVELSSNGRPSAGGGHGAAELSVSDAASMSFRDHGGAPQDIDGQSRGHRIQLAGQRWAYRDLVGLSSVDINPRGSLLQSVASIESTAGIGEARCERLTNKLNRYHADDGQESGIKLMIESFEESKLNEARSIFSMQPRSDDGVKGRVERKREEFKNKKDFDADDFAVVKFLFDKDIKNRKDGRQVAKDFGDWADAKVASGNLGNKDLAEQAMSDIIKMAEKGNPFARELLASCLCSGNQDSQTVWLQSRRGEQIGENSRRPMMPTLAPELADKLKAQAAKALIGIGRAGLSKAEQIALAIGLGHAFHNIDHGDKTRAIRDLADTTSEHFRKVFGDRDTSQTAPPERKQNQQNAVAALFEAVKAGVTGHKQIAKFVAQLAGFDKWRPNSQTGGSDSQRTGQDLVKSPKTVQPESREPQRQSKQDVFVRPPDTSVRTSMRGEKVKARNEKSAESVTTGRREDQIRDSFDVITKSARVVAESWHAHAESDEQDNSRKRKQSVDLWSAGDFLSMKNSPESMRDAYRNLGTRLKNSVRNGVSIKLESMYHVISAGDVTNGRTQRHIARLLRDSSMTWQLGEDKALSISDSHTLVKLDSGRLYNPMTNQFFKKVGGVFVPDDKPASEQERGQIANIMAQEQMKAIMRSHLVLLLNASLNASQFANGGSLLKNGRLHVNSQLSAAGPKPQAAQNAGKRSAAR